MLKEVSHGDRGHAVLSMSGTERDVNCSGNLLFKLDPANEPKSHAVREEGETLHEWSEKGRRLLLGRVGVTPEVVDAWANRFIPDTDMAELVSSNIKRNLYTEELFAKKCVSFKRLIEERVEYTPDNWGTLDYALYGTTHQGGMLVYLQDDKWGYEVVKAKGNMQLIGYFFALYTQLRLHSIEKVYLGVYQPRTPGNPLDIHEYSIAEMEDFRHVIDKKNEHCLKVLSGETQPIYKPGKWCKYCWGSGKCKAQTEAAKANGVTLLDKADLTMPSVEVLSLEQMLAIKENEKQIEEIIKGVNAHLRRRLELGLPCGDWKLVDGQSKAKWMDDEAAVANGLRKLGIDPMRESLITIGDARKAAGKAKLAQVNALTVKPTPNKNLVKESDMRPALPAKGGIALLTD